MSAGRFRLTPPPRLSPSEKQVMKAVETVLKLRQMYPVRIQSGLLPVDRPDGKRDFLRFGEPGIPDYCVPRFFIETKRPGGKLSDAQKEKIFELERFWKLRTAVIESPEDLILWLNQHPDL